MDPLSEEAADGATEERDRTLACKTLSLLTLKSGASDSLMNFCFLVIGEAIFPMSL